MNEKLTKRRALEICRDLWDWLAKDEDREKCDWPGFDSVQLTNNCPCCEFAHIDDQVDSPGCSKCLDCPLWPLWGSNCNNPESPFRKWWSGINRRASAKAIADACRAELAKLPKEEA